MDTIAPVWGTRIPHDTSGLLSEYDWTVESTQAFGSFMMERGAGGFAPELTTVMAEELLKV